MKIAAVTPYFPYPPDTGGKIRSYHLIKVLSRHHEVDVYSVYYGDAPSLPAKEETFFARAHLVPLNKKGTNTSRLIRCLTHPIPRLIDHFHTSEAVEEIRSSVKAGNYDLLFLDEICMAPYLDGLPGPKLMMRHKIDFLHYREVAASLPVGLDKWIEYVEAFKLRRFEGRASRAYSGIVCCSNEDEVVVQAQNPNIPTVTIGNGVDLDYFSLLPERNGPPTLVYVGTMNYFPNVDAVHFFFREIHPHLIRQVPNVRIVFVGHNPTAELLGWQRLPGVMFTGTVPDVRPYLAESTACFVPLRLGGGTRLKILEAISSGRAVVSTSVGAEGLALRHGEHVLLADDPIDFARQATELLLNPDLRKKLAGAARPYVAAHYSWGALGERLEGVCREVVEKGTH